MKTIPQNAQQFLDSAENFEKFLDSPASDTFISENNENDIALFYASRTPSVSDILANISANKSQNISLRMNATTLAKIKQFSEKNGVKYQTFINATLDELAKSL